MIVPIVEKDVHESPGDLYIYLLPDHRAWLVQDEGDSWWLETPIDLPHHASVGMSFNLDTGEIVD